MNREIKFRAYDSVNKVMEYDVNVNQGKPVKQGYQWFNESNTVYHSELMQYTGLNDKNGTAIYEGDIINDSFGNRKGVIGYNKYVASFEIKKYDGIHLLSTNNSEKFFEVIGNIYENPELLGGDEE